MKSLKNLKRIKIILLCGALNYISFFFMYDRFMFIKSLSRYEVDFMNLKYKLYPINLYVDNLYIVPMCISVVILSIYLINYELTLDINKLRSILNSKILTWLFRLLLIFGIIYIINFMSTGNIM